MKPLLFAAALTAMTLGGPAYAADAAQTSPEAQAQAAADKAAGLPDLTKINRPAARVTSKVNINDVPRTPSFYEKSKNGTEVTEYRDHGKPVEIDVKSNFGTRYQMSAPPDTVPRPHDAGEPVTRLPSISLHY